MSASTPPPPAVARRAMRGWARMAQRAFAPGPEPYPRWICEARHEVADFAATRLWDWGASCPDEAERFVCMAAWRRDPHGFGDELAGIAALGVEFARAGELPFNAWLSLHAKGTAPDEHGGASWGLADPAGWSLPSPCPKLGEMAALSLLRSAATKLLETNDGAPMHAASHMKMPGARMIEMNFRMHGMAGMRAFRRQPWAQLGTWALLAMEREELRASTHAAKGPSREPKAL